eukprot:Selendium_serpulae@DN6135_c0_g1_i2.p1
MTQLLEDHMTMYLIFGPPILGILCAMYQWSYVASIELTNTIGQKPTAVPLNNESISDKQLQDMKRVAKYIADGAVTFLFAEYKFMALYVCAFSCVLIPVIGVGTTVSFVVGAVVSVICGYIGMKIAVFANVRTTFQACKDLGPAFMVALRAGSVMGFILCSLGVGALGILIMVYKMPVFYGADTKSMFEAIAGYGLGGSSIALFGRVGGGIYTKAADVGADLSGKNDYNIKEDDPRNPACIADNVGDNVGDVAGMGADLFGSLAESTCAALVIGGTSLLTVDAVPGLAQSWSGLMFPVTLSSIGIIVGILTMIGVQTCCAVRAAEDVERALKMVIFLSTVLQSPAAVGLAWMVLPSKFYLFGFGVTTWWKCAIAVNLGLWSGLVIGFVTEYFTSHTYNPVKEIADQHKTAAATGIISGLAVGYESVIIPVCCLGATVCVGHQLCGMFGVALGALGMLGTLAMGLTIDAYGPISDNAGGIAEMAQCGESVRYITDVLDAAGNTTAAVGKGFAIGSAALVSLALFGAYTVRAQIQYVNILDAWTFVGLLYGAMMPYAFSAMTMKSVGRAAAEMHRECLTQFAAIMAPNSSAQPDYARCISISTAASLREMIAPGCLVIFSPIFAGMIFGKNCCAGLLAGALVSGVQLAISASNSGGAWDNAKKYIEAGGLGHGHQKGSETHKNAVTGDTVGDPLKDTSGPSLNILVKLSAITSLVFGSMLADHFSNSEGGPVWIAPHKTVN